MKTKLLLILALTLVLPAIGCQRDQSRTPLSKSQVKVGETAPIFILDDMDGKRFSLEAARGSVVIVFFWRVKCKECIEDMDKLNVLYEKYRGKGLQVVSVAAESEHSASIYAVNKIITEHKYSFPVIKDSDTIASGIYEVMWAPAGYIINRSGKLAAVKSGRTDWTSPDVESLIEGLLKASG